MNAKWLWVLPVGFIYLACTSSETSVASGTTSGPGGATSSGSSGTMSSGSSGTGAGGMMSSSSPWSVLVPGRSDAIAVDASGNAVVAGQLFAGVLCGQTVSKPSLFLAKLDPSGKCLWAKTFDYAGVGFTGPSIAIDPADGGIVLAGNFSGDLDLGGMTLSTVDDRAFFLAKYDARR